VGRLIRVKSARQLIQTRTVRIELGTRARTYLIKTVRAVLSRKARVLSADIIGETENVEKSD